MSPFRALFKQAGFNHGGTLNDHYRFGEDVEVFEKLLTNF